MLVAVGCQHKPETVPFKQGITLEPGQSTTIEIQLEIPMSADDSIYLHLEQAQAIAIEQKDYGTASVCSFLQVAKFEGRQQELAELVAKWAKTQKAIAANSN